MMATPPDLSQPSATRALTASSFAALGALALVTAPGFTTPSDPASFLEWWAASGTPAVAISMVRLVGIAIGVAIFVSSIASLAVSVSNSVNATTLWTRLTPRPMRRLLAASVVVSAAAAPTAASAQDLPAPPLPIITDMGISELAESTTRPLPVLTNVGPVESSSDDAALDQPSGQDVTTDDQWNVEVGDHLWRVAEETLIDRGADPSTGQIERYWRRLIDENRSVIGDDADLIHPGMLLTLPA